MLSFKPVFRTEEEFDFWQEFTGSGKSVFEKIEEWKKWKETKEGKLCTRRRHKAWLKKIQR